MRVHGWVNDLASARDASARRHIVFVHDYIRAGPRRIHATLIDALRDRIEDKLPNVAMPVCIVCGGRDPVSTVEWGERLARLTASRVAGGECAEFHVIRDAAHAIPF